MEKKWKAHWPLQIKKTTIWHGFAEISKKHIEVEIISYIKGAIRKVQRKTYDRYKGFQEWKTSFSEGAVW